MDGEPDDFDSDKGDLGGFSMPMADFQMPDFSSIGRTMKMLSWLPAIISFVSVMFLVFLSLVIYNGLAQPDYNITYWNFMVIVVVSLLAGLITGALVKTAVARKKSGFGF